MCLFYDIELEESQSIVYSEINVRAQLVKKLCG